MSRPVRRTSSAPASATPRNRREAAVVDWLIGRLANRLADRSGERHEPPWEPRQNVLLGVLEPTRIQPPPDPSTSVPEAAESGSDEAHRPPAATGVNPGSIGGEVPTLGLDFRIGAQGSTGIDLEIDVEFAIYLEEIATLAEQRGYLGDQAPKEDLPDARPSSTDATKPEATSISDVPVRKRARAKKTRLLGAWHRRDVAPDTIRLTVPLTGMVVSIGTPLTEATREAITAHYESNQAMRADS
jgi:hypothetical protein